MHKDFALYFPFACKVHLLCNTLPSDAQCNQTSQQAENSGMLEGNVLFSEISVNPTELFYYVHALCEQAFYMLFWRMGKQPITCIFYWGDGVKLERNYKNIWWLHAGLNSVGQRFVCVIFCVFLVCLWCLFWVWVFFWCHDNEMI